MDPDQVEVIIRSYVSPCGDWWERALVPLAAPFSWPLLVVYLSLWDSVIGRPIAQFT